MTSALAVNPASPQGDQTPRILVAPESATSAGAEAIELASLAGLNLDPWQQLCLQVGLGEQPDGRWSAFEAAVVVARQNGKGSLFEALILAKLFLFGDELIIYSAHEFKTAREAFRRLGALMEHPEISPRVLKAVKNPSEFGYDLRSGQRIRFFARTGGSGRGWSADTLILDEAFKLGGDAMAALLPTLSTRPNPQVWYGSSAAWATSEQLHAVRKRALDNSSPRLAYLEWSAPEDCDPADPAMWALANPAVGHRMELDFISAEFEALPLPEFRRERLSIPDLMTGELIFPDGLWLSRQDRTSTTTSKLTFAVDVTPDRSSAAIAVASPLPGDRVHVEVIDHKPGVDWVVPRLIELAKRWRPGTLVVDPGGPAGSLMRDLDDARIKPHLIGGREYAQACGAFYDAVVAGSIQHIGQPELDVAVGAAIKRNLADAWAWNRRGGADLSPLVAVTLAHWGVSSRKSRSRAINLSAALEASENGSSRQPDA